MRKMLRMMLHRPFLTLVPTVDGDVLQVLAGAEASFTPGDVHRLLGLHSVAGVRLALKRLEEQGIVASDQAGRARLYRLNRTHVLAGAVVEISQAKQEVVERLKLALEAWSLPCAYAALFGSAAVNQMAARSDIDVLVVRPANVGDGDSEWRVQIELLAEQCTSWTGNDCRVLELSEKEASSGSAVLSDIVRTGITLAGPSTFLSRLHSEA